MTTVVSKTSQLRLSNMEPLRQLADAITEVRTEVARLGIEEEMTPCCKALQDAQGREGISSPRSAANLFKALSVETRDRGARDPVAGSAVPGAAVESEPT